MERSFPRLRVNMPVTYRVIAAGRSKKKKLKRGQDARALDVTSGALVMTSVTASKNGILIQTKEHLEKGTFVELTAEIKIPPSLRVHFTVEGQVVRVRAGALQGHYQIAIRFDRVLHHRVLN